MRELRCNIAPDETYFYYTKRIVRRGRDWVGKGGLGFGGWGSAGGALGLEERRRNGK
jgi:hypothetical protein